MFKFVAATALTGLISAIDLQEVSQDLAELEDLENDQLEVGLKDLDEIEELGDEMPETLDELQEAACEDLSKAYHENKEALMKASDNPKMGEMMEELEQALEAENWRRVRELFYAAVRPAMLQATNRSGKMRAVANI